VAKPFHTTQNTVSLLVAYRKPKPKIMPLTLVAKLCANDTEYDTVFGGTNQPTPELQ
jgi:hypothetical protein